MPVKRLYTPDVLSQLSRQMMAGKTTDGSGGGAMPMENQQLVVTKQDFEEALRNVSKSVSREQLVRFREWEKEFGSK
jgi:SpoVK/Ycf46/Vps4 family AAA+-type ATPase